MPKVASAQVKSFAKSKFQHYRSKSKFTKGNAEQKSETQILAKSPVEQEHEGIKKIFSADPFKKKQSIVRSFSADPFKKDESDQSAVNLSSPNEDNTTSGSPNKATIFEKSGLEKTKGAFNDVTVQFQNFEPESRSVPKPDWEPDTFHSPQVSMPYSLRFSDSSQKSRPVSFAATGTDFLDSVNATLSYGQVDYAASGMPSVNFAAVIYGDQGFTMAAPERNKSGESVAGEEPYPAAQMAQREEYVHNRSRASSDGTYSSKNTAARTRMFSFSHENDESDQNSLTDFSDDENQYISVKLPSTRIFKDKPVPHSACRIRDHMPDLYTTPSPKILQPNTEGAGKPEDDTEKSQFDDLISKINEFVCDQLSEHGSIPGFITVKGVDASIQLPNHEALVNEESASVKPLNLTVRANPKSILFSKDEIENLAECCLQSHKSDEWTAIGDLLCKVEEITGFNGFSSVSLPSETRSEEMKVFAQFADNLKVSVSRNGSKDPENAPEEADTLINIIYGYRQIFLHLIQNVVLPNGEKFRNMLKELLYLRSLEGDLVMDALKINSEIGETWNWLENHEPAFDSPKHQKLSDCLLSLKRVENRFQRFQNGLSRLEKSLIAEWPKIISTILMIHTVRTRLLKLWNSLYTSSDLAEQFEGVDLLALTHKEEYETMTLWYSEVDVNQLQKLSNKNLNTLASSHTSIQTMVESLQEAVDKMGSGFVSSR